MIRKTKIIGLILIFILIETSLSWGGGCLNPPTSSQQADSAFSELSNGYGESNSKLKHDVIIYHNASGSKETTLLESIEDLFTEPDVYKEASDYPSFIRYYDESQFEYVLNKSVEIENYLHKNSYRMALPIIKDGFDFYSDEKNKHYSTEVWINFGNNNNTFTPYYVSFEKGNIPSNILKFYNYLWESEILPCSVVVIPDDPNVTISEILNKNRIIAIPNSFGYPREFDKLLCRLNPQKCTNNSNNIRYRPGETIIVPNVQLNKHDTIEKIRLGYIQTSLNSDTIKSIADPILELKRNIYVDYLVQEKNYNRKKAEGEFYETLNIFNGNWDSIAYKTDYNAFYDPSNERIEISVPSFNYSTEVNLLNSHIEYHENKLQVKNRSLEELLANSAFSISKTYSKKDLIDRAKLVVNSTKDVNLDGDLIKIKERFTQIKKNIHYPCVNYDALGTSTICIVDKGIDIGNVYLGKNSPDNLSSSQPEIKDGSQCTIDESHGTHIWGIIHSFVPNILHGFSQNAEVNPFEYIKEDTLLQEFLQSPPFYTRLHVINLSIDLSKMSPEIPDNTFYELLKNTSHYLYVIAAGNEGQKYSSDRPLSFPINYYNEKNLIFVAALDQEGNDLWMVNQNAEGSNFGEAIHIAAPGEEIPSVCAGKNSIGLMTGTSQATAMVSSAAALLKGEDENMVANKIKTRILYTADFLPNLEDKVMWGRLNLSRAIDVSDNKICLFQDYNEDNQPSCDGENASFDICDNWIKSNAPIKFYVKTIDNLFVEVESVQMQEPNGKTIEINTNNILRIYRVIEGGKTKYIVGYLDAGNSYQLTKNSNINQITASKKTGYKGQQLYLYSKVFDQLPITPKHIQLEGIKDYVKDTDFPTL